MVRSLRYPRMCVFVVAITLLCALGRDVCLSAQMLGWAQMLLLATVLGILCSFMLMSCRITVDEMGIGVGVLLSMRYAAWDELATLGELCCNSRRAYLYGTYRERSDFINLLHMAPRCGRWGFVAPLNEKLRDAVKTYCPYPVDLSPITWENRPKGMRVLWQQAAVYALVMIPSALVAVATCALMLYAVAQKGASPLLVPAAAAMFSAGVLLIRRTVNTLMTCPAISEAGVSIGRGIYMAWEDVRFAYVRRQAQVSGLFFLSREIEEVSRHAAPPVLCLSMPDTSTLLLAYLTYCPHAPQGMDA
ncbi:MAG: hypothetical protein IKB82_04185 [Clostridia bacterium]|nr:hypothetical protein [Clostridia bacterium]